MTETLNNSPMAAAIACLPLHIRDAIRAVIGLYGGVCNEIRLSLGGQAYITVHGLNILTPEICTKEDIKETVSALCGHSLYAHSDTIREGFIFTDSGLRVGVCGRAVPIGTGSELVREISSVSIRIPHRCIGAADLLYPYVIAPDGPHGMLVWSAPGVGKTTALRELASLLSRGDTPYRTAIIDTRFELSEGLSGGLLDVFSGYPRAIGMEIAVRTMSPQIVICDEIAGEEDAAAVFKCASAGVAVIASAHSGSITDLIKRNDINLLIEASIFKTLVGLYRCGPTVCKKITNASGEVILCSE